MDKRTLEQIYNDNIDRIYRFFYCKTVSKETAEDLTSQTFLTFAEEIKGGRVVDNPIGYLYGIAKHIFFGYLRHKQYEIPLDLERIEFYEEVTQVSFKIQSNGYSKAQIAGIIARLPEKQRIVATLRLLEKLTTKEICQRLAKDENYVKTTMKRAIHSIKAMLNVPPDAHIY